tara:strand:- start:1391 stop:2095 length:705 start_codon:yes stop_codon:yes gene_type:complete
MLLGVKYMGKLISEQNEWSGVAEELAAENLKLASYDESLLGILGSVAGRDILDYGCGPGVLASTLLRGKGNVQAYDVSEEMRHLSGEKIGHDNVISTVGDISQGFYDAVICNLVMCIVDEGEVRTISRNIRSSLKDGQSRAYVGFCNPHLLDVAETQLDLRPEPACEYHENHSYMKTKKEGGYQMVENHRPIEWYESVFAETGLKVVERHFTPEYELGGRTIQDFIIFELARGE